MRFRNFLGQSRSHGDLTIKYSRAREELSKQEEVPSVRGSRLKRKTEIIAS